MIRFLFAAHVALVVAVFCYFVNPALAQSTTVDVGSIFGTWKPYIVELVGIVALVFVGIIAELVRRWFGVSIEAQHRAALQTAITNAAGLALNRLDNTLAGKTVDVRHPVLAAAVNYVGKGAPDALRHFGITEDKIREMIVAKLPQVANTTTPPAG